MQARHRLPVITNCDNCGACCTGQEALPVGYYLGIHGGDPTLLPPELLAELNTMRDQFNRENSWPANGQACVWYDAVTKRCKHYEHRPDICRDGVVPGDEACRRWRRSTGVDRQPRYSLMGGKIVKS